MGDTVGAPVNEETVGHLRQRLNVMRDIVKVRETYMRRYTLAFFWAFILNCSLCVWLVSIIFLQLQDEDKDGKKKVKRRQGKCIDTIIDGSLMGAVLAVCLAMVIGASFFAYKNLYFAVMKKWYPEAYKAP